MSRCECLREIESLYRASNVTVLANSTVRVPSDIHHAILIAKTCTAFHVSSILSTKRCAPHKSLHPAQQHHEQVIVGHLIVSREHTSGSVGRKVNVITLYYLVSSVCALPN